MRAGSILLPLLLLAGCDLSMTKQDRRETQSSPTLWPGGPAADLLPAGTVAQDRPAHDADIGQPPHVTPALLVRGQDQYGVYCAPCHGGTGQGDGIVVQRGFPRPPSYLEPRLMAAPAAHVFAVATNGYGVMYGFGDRILPADRWAIAAYVKALQRATAR